MRQLPDWLKFFRRRKNDYTAVFESEVGQRVLRDIARECGFLKDAYVPGDPSRTCYHVGKQWIMLHILGVMRMKDKQIEDLAKEMERVEIETTERGVML